MENLISDNVSDTDNILRFNKHKPVIFALAPRMEKSGEIVMDILEYVNLACLPEEAQKTIRNMIRPLIQLTQQISGK